MKVRWNRLFVVLSLCGMLLMMGNSPAPYWACEGKAVLAGVLLWQRLLG